jgi:pimeloyl-ACP methyl ester carboxylesterase
MLQFIRRWAALYPLGRLLRLTPDWHIRLTLVLIRWTSQFRIGGRYTRLEPLLPRLQTKPVLMISGDRDKYVLPAVTTALSRRIGGRRCHVWVVPGARHNMSRQVAGEEYDERLCDFFSCLSNPPPTNPEPFTEAVRTQTA